MRNLTDIKYRMKGVADTKQITSAMDTISVAKMRKAMTKFENNQLYFQRVRETISDIVRHTNSIQHRYLNKSEGNRKVFIVISSDKGLAGGYNHNVLEYAWKFMNLLDHSEAKPHSTEKSARAADSDSTTSHDNSEQVSSGSSNLDNTSSDDAESIEPQSEGSLLENTSVFTVGNMTREFFERKRVPIDIEFTHSAFNPTMYDAMQVVESIINLFDQKMMDEVFIVYTSMTANNMPKPDIIKLLPLSRAEVVDDTPITAEREEYFRELEYDPSPDEVLKVLVPQYLGGIVYGALVQSVAAEHSSRRLAMSNATKNATEILDELKIEYNTARQESVTKELSEIITSSMGVKK